VSGRWAQVARDFDLTEIAVREWVKQAGRDAGTRVDGVLTSVEREELVQLRLHARVGYSVTSTQKSAFIGRHQVVAGGVGAVFRASRIAVPVSNLVVVFTRVRIRGTETSPGSTAGRSALILVADAGWTVMAGVGG
jgi:transposase-like protein